MPDETDKILADHINSLPQYVKDAFRAAQPFEKIRKMTTDFRLHLDEGERLEQEILLVMLGLSAPDTFIDETSKSFGLSEEDSKKLVDRVTQELFVPIRESMRTYMEERAKETPPAVPEVPPTKPVSEAPAIRPTLQQQLSITRTSPAQSVSNILPQTPAAPQSAPVAPSVATPVLPTAGEMMPVPVSVAKVAVKSSLPGIDVALSKAQSSSSEKIDVGISPAKSTYKVDPYLEPPI